MGKITDLPIELLEYIFDNVGTRLSHGWYDDMPSPNRAFFPFNVASTCMLWLRVMKSRPKYWHQVVIDIADDPSPFLDTLTLFAVDRFNIARIIIVFSSMKDSTSHTGTRIEEKVHEEAKIIENTRARAVFEHLEGSLVDCAGVTFDLVYQSSLPSFARLCSHRLPILQQLRLTCATHDCDEVVADPCHGQHRFYPLNALQSVAMTGASFMEICDCHCEPYQEFPLGGQVIYELSINHFVFNRIEQVREFQEVLASLELCSILSFSDLTLTCSGLMEPNFDIFIEATHLMFNSVSYNFLEAFMPPIFNDHQVEILTFRRCTIPKNIFWDPSRGILSDSLQLLQLIDIPHKDIYGLYDAIRTLTPEHVQLRRCDGVTDKLLADLATSASTKIRTVQLHDCSGFSSRGVRAFFCARRDLHLESPEENDALRMVEVCGTGPLLAADDAAFFLAEEAKDFKVSGDGKEGDEKGDDDYNKDQEDYEMVDKDGGEDEEDHDEDEEDHDEDEEDHDEDEEDHDEDEEDHEEDDEELFEDSDLDQGSSVTRVEWNVVGNDIPDGYVTYLHHADEVKPIILRKRSSESDQLARASKGVMYDDAHV